MTRPFALDPLFQASRVVAGVGPRIGKLLEKLNISRVVDFFWHLPAGVIDRRYAPKIREAQAGQVATLTVRVEQHVVPGRKSLPYRVKCADDTGVIDLTFFNARAEARRRCAETAAADRAERTGLGHVDGGQPHRSQSDASLISSRSCAFGARDFFWRQRRPNNLSMSLSFNST